MNSEARCALIARLGHLGRHGSSMSMLAMTVTNTSDGLLAGIIDGAFSLDYPKAGWLDILRSNKFKAFCKAHAFPIHCEKWGKERVVRANIGSDLSRAADAIDACFDAVYNQSGPFGLELRGFEWQPSGNSFENDAAKPRASS